MESRSQKSSRTKAGETEVSTAQVLDKAMDALTDTHKELMATRAELSRIRTLLDDTERIGQILNLNDHEDSRAVGWSKLTPYKRRKYLAMADQLKAYLLGKQ